MSPGNVFGSCGGVCRLRITRRLVGQRNHTIPVMTLTVVSLALCKRYRDTRGQGALIGMSVGQRNLTSPVMTLTVMSHALCKQYRATLGKGALLVEAAGTGLLCGAGHGGIG